MSSYNPIVLPLNSWSRLLNLGNQPKIPRQCNQNLRFINQDSANSRNRYRLRRAFGNQIFNLHPQENNYIIFFIGANKFTMRQRNTTAEPSAYGVDVIQNTQLSQFNRSATNFTFTVPKDYNYNINSSNYSTQTSVENFFSSHIGMPFDITDNSFVPSLTSSQLSTNTSLNINDITKIYLYNNQGNIFNNIISTELVEIESTPTHIIDNLTNPNDIKLQISDDTGEYDSGLTPFRKAFNAGDMLTKNNSATSNLINKPPNQISSLRNIFGWQNNAGSVKQKSNGSFYSGNPRFVYDGSDYARFKKLQAINRNYNDLTFGGDRHNGSQEAYRHAR